MCRYVGVVIFKGQVEEVQTFMNEGHAMAYVNERRREYGMEDSSDSLTWDTKLQLPVRVVKDEESRR